VKHKDDVENTKEDTIMDYLLTSDIWSIKKSITQRSMERQKVSAIRAVYSIHLSAAGRPSPGFSLVGLS